MATIPDTPTILQIATISQYLASRTVANKNFYNNQVIDKRLPELISITRGDVQWAYNRNPSDTTLVKTEEYLYALCAPFSQEARTIISNSAQSPPVITGPANRSGNPGNNITFSVTVVSALSYTLQWYDYLGNLIPGATGLSYIFMNAQLTDSGKTFFVRATNAAGTVVSATATLTITAGLVAQYYYGDTDYSDDINAGNNNVPYVGTFPITSGQPLSFTWPAIAANKFIVVAYPISETTKTAFSNAPLNNGLIPSLAFDNVKIIGSSKLIFSRSGNPFGQNTLVPLIFS